MTTFPFRVYIWIKYLEICWLKFLEIPHFIDLRRGRASFYPSPLPVFIYFVYLFFETRFHSVCSLGWPRVCYVDKASFELKESTTSPGFSLVFLMQGLKQSKFNLNYVAEDMRMALNSRPSGLHFPSTGITALSHHAHLLLLFNLPFSLCLKLLPQCPCYQWFTSMKRAGCAAVVSHTCSPSTSEAEAEGLQVEGSLNI